MPLSYVQVAGLGRRSGRSSCGPHSWFLLLNESALAPRLVLYRDLPGTYRSWLRALVSADRRLDNLIAVVVGERESA